MHIIITNIIVINSQENVEREREKQKGEERMTSAGYLEREKEVGVLIDI